MTIKLYAYDVTNDNIGYHVIGPNEDMSGEYVPLAEYQKLKRSFTNELRETNDSWNRTCDSTRKTGEVIEHTLEGKITELKALIQRVVDSNIYDKPNLEDDLRKAL